MWNLLANSNSTKLYWGKALRKILCCQNYVQIIEGTINRYAQEKSTLLKLTFDNINDQVVWSRLKWVIRYIPHTSFRLESHNDKAH